MKRAHTGNFQTQRLVKVSPGKRAEWWQECLEGGYICVGWYKVGDLRRFKSPDNLESAMRAKEYPRCPGMASKKAKELWILKGLQEGDRVIANRGNNEVLAVGTVKEAAYTWTGE